MSETHAETSISATELWKAQLGYVSGTILAWGAVLLQFWPVLARLQTGAHVLALGRDEGPLVPAVSFYLLALLIAAGLGMLIFGSLHMVARGFWLTGLSMDGAPRATVPVSDRLARGTYLVLHVFWATSLVVLCLVLLSAVSALLAALFARQWGWPLVVARVVASVLAFAPLYAAAIALYRLRRSKGPRTLVALARRIGSRHMAVAYVSLPLLWLLVLQFSYRADVRLTRHVFSRTTDAHIVIAVELGGAVSNPSPARVELMARGGVAASDALALTHVDKGLYVAVLPTRPLHTGAYEIALTYPHGTLAPTFPFYRSRIDKRVGFVVVD